MNDGLGFGRASLLRRYQVSPPDLNGESPTARGSWKTGANVRRSWFCGSRCRLIPNIGWAVAPYCYGCGSLGCREGSLLAGPSFGEALEGARRLTEHRVWGRSGVEKTKTNSTNDKNKQEEKRRVTEDCYRKNCAPEAEILNQKAKSQWLHDSRHWRCGRKGVWPWAEPLWV